MMFLVMVKLAVAEPEASLDDIVCTTGSPGGAITVAVNAPLLSVATEDGEVASCVPSHLMVMVVEAAKP